MASNLVLFGIPGIALGLAAVFVWGVAHAARQAGAASVRLHALLAALGIGAFMAFIAGLATSGLLARFDLRPPPLMLWMVLTLGLALGVGLSPLGRRLSTELPFVALIGFQAFRLPLELVMHRAAEEGVMPTIMSYGGYNFDILSGISALLLALALRRGSVPRAVIVAWNVLGAALLANIVTVAFLATPLVRAFGDQQINRWITQFPYVWMAVMVSAALLGHVLLARKLVAQRAHTPATKPFSAAQLG